jgi:hypothetical protein
MAQFTDNQDDEERAFREKAREEARARLAARSQRAEDSSGSHASGSRNTGFGRHGADGGEAGRRSSRGTDIGGTHARSDGSARAANGSARRSNASTRGASSRSGAASTGSSAAETVLAVLSAIAGFLVSVVQAIWHGLVSLYYWVSDHRPYSFIAVAVVVLLLVVGIASCSRSCSSDQATTDSSSSAAVESPDSTEGDQTQGEGDSTVETADFSQVPDTVDASVVENLRTLAESDQRIVDIVNNVAAYANIGNGGAEEQAKLLKLASDDPEAIDFVHDLPDNYPSDAQSYDEAVTQGTFPRLYQWDKRWGYSTYCGRDFGTTGCCPTVMSMVYMGIEGTSDMTPAAMGQFATELGYVDEESGTYGNFVDAVCEEFGWTYYDFSPDSDALTEYLQNGYVVVINLGPGDFTTSGHFILATGLDENGDLIINDPYSSVRSNETWDVDRVANQSIRMTAIKI